jgi:hypothetical protein
MPAGGQLWRLYFNEARSSLNAFRVRVRESREELDRVLHDRGVERLIREFDLRGSEVGRRRVVRQLRRHLDSVVAYGGWVNRPPRAVWSPLEIAGDGSAGVDFMYVGKGTFCARPLEFLRRGACTYPLFRARWDWAQSRR